MSDLGHAEGPVIRLGTRGSALALAQTRWVQHELEQSCPGLSVEVVVITTSGDRFVDRPLTTLGGKGLFVKEIEEALTECRIDCAVHSMKDLPGALAPGLVLAAVPKREDPRDLLITSSGRSLAELPAGARLGTTSLRRAALVRAFSPAVEVRPLRGNVDTRLRKLDGHELDAIVLAAAGLRRLGIERGDAQPLDPTWFVPAIGQGALAIETRLDDVPTSVAALDHPATRTAVEAERAFLTAVGGDCHTPLAAYAICESKEIHLRALIASPDGRRVIRGERRGQRTEAVALGAELADDLLRRGGDVILRALREAS